ncbi:hypothetical protein [Pseudomonas sp. S1Bt23]|uniref:hypothetical protein n=1 Tax=Pseudomonas sp. S1Bt23 TaxID=3095074 RepID=UPI002A5AF883|nr:hypothetical protein [Pseudomonas sp. S1Bt23]WPO45726.1 hypothetical protein SHB59_20830 [Pseudomonas sp. S1Bt23]
MTEHIYWRDIEDLAGNWNGLGVEVKRPASGKPNLRLLSGHNRRMQLVLGDQTLLWGTMSRCLYGVWLVRNHLLEHLPQTLVGSIDSPRWSNSYASTRPCASRPGAASSSSS